MLAYTEAEGSLTFTVRVVPRASRSAIVGAQEGALRIRVAAPPVEGAANEELVRFLARTLGVPARAVEVVSGHASKTKLVRARGVRPDALLRLAAPAE